MSVAPSRARSRSRAPSTARVASGPAPVVVPPASPRPPIYVDVPATPRPRSRSRGPSGGGPLAVTAPGLSGGRGMFKRLIVACDGTWLNSDNGLSNGRLSIPSNVTRISRAIKAVSQDGVPQIVNYHYGVGTQGGALNRLVSGATGEGLADNIRESYSFLANNYHPGDEIFLVGFSRGSYTARSIAGLIGEVGLLTKKGLNSLPEVFEDVQHRRDPRYVPRNPDVPFPRKPSANDPLYADELERRGLTRLDIPIKAIGVWDTVGSLGMPRIGWLTKVGLQSQQSKEMSFYDTKLSDCIENAFQALALDEKRSAFSPAVWERPEGNKTTLRQVWFPGTHSNCGGGFDDQQLANITLAWMMSQLAPFLDMRDEYLFEQDAENDKYYKKDRQDLRPWSFGEIHQSMTGLFALGGGSFRTPGHYYAVDPHTGRQTSRPLRQTNEYIHPSARARIRLQGPGVADKGVYECRALTDEYKLVVDYGNQSPKTGDPDVYWRIKYKDHDAVKTLPEAPLWSLERELCRKDPETFDYLRRPPATGRSGDKKRKSERPKSAEITSPGGGGGSTRFSTRKSFPADARGSTISKGPRDSSAVMVDKRARSRSRARSLDYDDRATDIRDEMPHRREKDRAWWENMSGANGAGRKSPKGARFDDGGRSPRRSSMRV